MATPRACKSKVHYGFTSLWPGDNAQDQVFVFPDIFVEKSSEDGEGSMEEMQKQFMEDEKQRQRGDPRRAGVTEWFGL